MLCCYYEIRLELSWTRDNIMHGTIDRELWGTMMVNVNKRDKIKHSVP